MLSRTVIVLYQCQILERTANANFGGPVARHALKRMPVKNDVALAIGINSGKAVEQCRFAGTVGADQPSDLAGLDFERDLVERDDSAKFHGDASNR
jgi:hypothetical protein